MAARTRAKPLAAFAIALVAICAPIASAASTTAGGLSLPKPPVVRDIICMTDCVGLRTATVGSTVQISGARLGSVTKVSFRGDPKRIPVPVDSPGSRTVQATVPEGAVNGKLKLRDASGSISVVTPERLKIAPADALDTSGSSNLRITDAVTRPRKAYYFGVKAPRLSYVLRGGGPSNDLRIDVVDRDGAVVRSMFRKDVPSNSTQTIKWNGRDGDGKPARSGAYTFVVRSRTGQVAKLSRKARRKARKVRNARRSRRGRRAARSTPANPMSFKLFSYIFPVRGPHTYGDGVGAPRSGHTHQGQDVLTSCGTKLVAARGGKVYYNTYQSAAGYYVVISPVKGTGGKSHVYMHLAKPSKLKVGSIVHTGQKIGVAGATGDATGCHLHFEIWSSPGWYTGGHFTNPTPSLKRWDRYS